MCVVHPEDVRLYSRNKNIVFEGEKRKRMIDKLVDKIVARLSSLTAPPTRVVFSERIIEYPLVFQYLDKNWRSILDFGCAEDLLPIHLASLGYNVTGVDFRRYPFTHPNFEFVQADILSWEPPKERYDCVMSVSTVEHVGLGGYGDPVKSDGDRIAVAKLFAALKPEGRLIVSVPFGKSTIQRNMRIYNHDGLCELMPNIETERFFSKSSRTGAWSEMSWHEMDSLEYDDYYTIAPAQGVAFVVAKKPY